MQLPAHTDISASTSQGILPAFKLISEELNKVKTLINEQLIAPARAENIKPLLGHLRARTGKMIRPGLVLLAGGCFGKITDEHIRVAAIIEMIHTATLLHDDVLDEAQKRRGQATINSLWGNESAVLLGDLVLSRVFKMCAELEPQAAEVISAATIRLCEGELRQVGHRDDWRLCESEYIDVITEKSAVLFSSCCRLGALLAEATEREVRSLADFGLNAGIAFQIADDLLDLVGDEASTGKTLGSDVEKHKLTLATIHLLREADGEERSIFVNSYLESKDARYDRAALAEVLGRYGSLEYARCRAQEFVAAAIRELADLKESDAKNALIKTAKFMADRKT